MNWVKEFLPDNLIDALGWTFFHSIWLGALIGLLLAATLILINNKYSSFRYKLTLAALSIFTISIIYVFFQSYETNTYSPLSDNIFYKFGQIENVSVTGMNESIDSSNDNSIYSLIRNYFRDNIPTVITFWFFGLMFFALRFMGGMLFLQKIKTRGIKELDIEWIYRTRELTRKMLENKFVPVYESINITVPIVIGLVKPVILLPIGIISGLPYRQVEAIIVHELAHIKRYDYLVNLLQSFIETVFFYHPAVWWISAQIREERENCCDDIVLENCEDPLVYSKALYNLQNEKSDQPNLALAASGNVNQLLRRIKRMNGERRKLSSGGRFAALVIVFLFIGAAVIISSTGNESRKNMLEASFINPVGTLEGSSSNTVKFSLPDTTSIKKGKRTLRFTTDENGEDKRYKAKLNNGKLEQLFIDGEEVEPKDFEKYERQIDEKVKEYDLTMRDYNARMDEYKQNMKKFREEMQSFKEKMKQFRGTNKHYRDFDFDFDFDFEVPHVSIPHFDVPTLDSAELHDIMKEVQYNVKQHLTNRSIIIPPIHIPKIHIPPIHIPKIEIPEIDLDEMKADLKCSEFDKEEFKKNMTKWKDEFSVEMKKFSEEMKKEKWNSDEFKKSMKELGKNMDKLKAEMKLLKEYLKDVKAELVKDKLIDEEDDLDGFYLSTKEMKIKGKIVPQELHKKYLEIYKKHYGKELDDDQKFQIND